MLRPYHLDGDKVKTVTTACLEQQPLQEKEKLDSQQNKMFRTTVGQLIWASLDRPDLMYCAKLHSESLHVQQLLEELQTGMCTTTFSYSKNNQKCITLYTDSTSATSLASKLGVNRRSRHIALRYLWIQDLRQAGEVDIKRVTTHENPVDIYTKLLPAPVRQKHLPQNGLLALLDGEGEEECMYYLKSKKHNNKSKDDDNKVFRQNHYNNMHKTIEQYKKQNVELQRQVDDLQQLVGERDAEVRDLAYKDLLPDQILRAQHALQALQDHLTEQHMRQLMGTEPLQAILGAISKKEEHDKHYYIQMIDGMDPVAIPQQEGQEKKEEGETTEGVSTQQKAEEILAAIRQRKQQSRQQQQHVTTSDGNDDNGRVEENHNRRRVETPRRQGEDTTAETGLAIVERQDRGELQVRRRRRRRLVVATTTTAVACLCTVTTSLSHFVFTTLPFVAQQLQVASNYASWRQVERLQLIYNYSCQAGDHYRSYYRTTLELYHTMTTTPVINVEETTAGTPSTTLPPLRAPKVQALKDWRDVNHYLVDNLVKSLQPRPQGSIPANWSLPQPVQQAEATTYYRGERERK